MPDNGAAAIGVTDAIGQGPQGNLGGKLFVNQNNVTIASVDLWCVSPDALRLLVDALQMKLQQQGQIILPHGVKLG